MLFLLVCLHVDPRVRDWFLMDSPALTYCLVLAYLFLVYVGPHFMKDREPVYLKPVLILYNFSLVILSAYMCFEVTPALTIHCH